MPFALVGFTLGFIEIRPSSYLTTLLLVILCMIFARSAAMAFNRWLDRDIDIRNPRTAVREIPAGVISSGSALWFVILNAAFFILTTFFINPLCFYLSPVALAIVLGYSYTKRFTALCHLVLGLGLALAPVGAYMAVTGSFALIPVMIGCSVLFWVAGFDIIYALQDEDFDKSFQLNSIPVRFGTVRSMRISELLHVMSAILMMVVVYLIAQQYPNVGWLAVSGMMIFIGLLLYQHLIIKPTDLSKVNMAFFTTNGIASVIFGCLLISDLLF